MKKFKFVSTVKVLNVCLSKKNLDRDLDPDFKKAWDPGPDSVNPDPENRWLYIVLSL